MTTGNHIADGNYTEWLERNEDVCDPDEIDQELYDSEIERIEANAENETPEEIAHYLKWERDNNTGVVRNTYVKLLERFK